jgi:hypothetical protein
VGDVDQGGGVQVDARDRHQPQYLWPRERLSRDLRVERRDLPVEESDLAQAAVERAALIERQLDLCQPASPARAEGVRPGRSLI